MAEFQIQYQHNPEPQTKENSHKKDWVAVFVTRETRRKLAIAKAKYGFKSYDELINHLLEKAGYV
jgi:hypothetical protein